MASQSVGTPQTQPSFRALEVLTDVVFELPDLAGPEQSQLLVLPGSYPWDLDCVGRAGHGNLWRPGALFHPFRNHLLGSYPARTVHELDA